MNRKRYLAPAIKTDEMDALLLQSASKAISDEQRGIGYGGVDVEGDKDPASRRQQDIWDD